VLTAVAKALGFNTAAGNGYPVLFRAGKGERSEEED